MGASFVVSPSGNIYPSTPVNDAAVLTMQRLDALLSNKKIDDTPSKSKSLFNDPIPKVPTIPISVPIVHDTQVNDQSEQVSMQQYKEMMRQTQRQLQALERQLEANEARHREDLIRAQDSRDNDLNAANQRTVRTVELELRELEIRERKCDQLEREHKARQDRQADSQKTQDVFSDPQFLCVSDPAGDVICDLAMMKPLDVHLQCERLGVSTVYGLLEHAISRHETLKKILALTSIGHSIKFVINRFKNVFSTLFRAPASTMSLISIAAMTKISPAVANKVRSAINFLAQRFSIRSRKLQCWLGIMGSFLRLSRQ